MTRVRMYFTVAPPFAEGPNKGLQPVHMYLAKLGEEWTEGPRQTRLSDKEAQTLVSRALGVNEEFTPDPERMFKGEIEEGKIPSDHMLCCQFDIRVETRDRKPHFRRTRAERFDFSRKYIPVWETCLDVQERTMSGLEREERKIRNVQKKPADDARKAPEA